MDEKDGARMNVILLGDQWDALWRRRQQLTWWWSQTGIVEHVIYVERPVPITSLLKILRGRAERDGTDRWGRLLANS